MRCLAAASSALRSALAGPPRPAECLGVARGALYLRISEPPGALAVLCHDAVRLPCGLMLPVTSAELPLTSLAAPSASFLVGDHAVRWTGPPGPVDVRAVREWAPARPASGKVNASVLAAVRAVHGLDGPFPAGQRLWHVDGSEFAMARAIANSLPWPEGRALIADLTAAADDHDASVAAAAGLLGRGPGLTPSGDDVLAGYLTGAAAFGLDAAALRQAIADLAPARTTTLSAALLWHAARGECIDELAAVAALLASPPRPESVRAQQVVGRTPSADRSLAAQLSGGSVTEAENVLHHQAERAVSRLLSVGHSSGAALARGLVIAAKSALNRQARRAA
jgi:Protein of unknown function (DUF2877)